MFNLLELHESKEDIGPKSWICIKGKSIFSLMNNILDEICNRNEVSRKRIAGDLSKKFNCSLGPFEEVFFSGKEWIPIILIDELLNIWSQFNSGELLENKIFEINCEIQFLKVNVAKGKPV